MEGYTAVGDLHKACGHPVRLQILEVLLRDGEACVCHLEAQLGQRQAAISQHLARLRAVGLVADRRDGWNVYYSVAEPSVASLLAAAKTTAAGAAKRSGRKLTYRSPSRGTSRPCPCPHCAHTAGAEAAAC
jgi:ArsR family transcriptional regulator